MRRVLLRAAILLAAGTWCLPGHAQPRYQFDAAGRPARVAQTWELRRADGGANHLLTSVARCGSQIFVSDGGNYVYRLDADASPSMLHLLAGDEQGIGRPSALAADCDRGRVHVVNTGPRTVVSLDTKSGAVVQTVPFRRELYEARSARLVEPDTLYIGGLWNADPARGLPARDNASFFETTWIGEKLSLASGTVEPGLPPHETRCPAASACTFADLDRIRGRAAAAWVASQGTGSRVALYDAGGNRTGTIDVSSPKFLRDGTELPVASKVETIERWKGRNSIIRRVFAVGDSVVTVHTLTDIPPDWKPGEQAQFQIFMNLHRLDGTGLVSDIKLPDLPIGRDETSVYVVDYGSGGRQSGAERMTLMRIPINAGPDAVR